MKKLIALSLFIFILRLLPAAASSSPTLCESNFTQNDLMSDAYLCERYNWSAKKIANIKWKDYFSCRQNTQGLQLPSLKAKHVCLNRIENKWLKSAQFSNCVESLRPHVSQSELYSRCQSSQKAKPYSSHTFNKCMTDIPVYLNASKSVFKICESWNFRQAFKRNKFHQCVHKFDDVFPKETSLRICTKSQKQLDHISSTSFDDCLSDAKDFKPKDAYLLCASEKNISDIEDTEIRSCLVKGLNAASFDYYLLKHLEVQKNVSKNTKNEFQYLFRDCNADNSFFTFDKKVATEGAYLSYHSDFNLHTSTRFANNYLVGGLSALRFDTNSNSLTFLSDDRGAFAPARLIKYNYMFDSDGNFILSEDKIIKLTTLNLELLQMDPEGFDVLENGNYIISSELDDLEGDDFISIYSTDGKKTETVALHEDYKPKSETRKECEVKTGFFFNSKTKTCKIFTTEKGFQANKSLESLSLSPNKQFMFTANEQALHQDKRFKKSWGFKKKIVDHVRIAKFRKNSSEKFIEESQLYYQLEAEVDNGLVDILSIDENRILTLERSWNSFKKKITARIFFVDLRSGENILASNSYKAKPVEKKLLLDLSDIEEQLSPGFRLLENFEGMDFGPTLPNGKQSLVLITDNNFKSYQRTLLLFLEMNLNNVIR
jgi:hypothetical protein